MMNLKTGETISSPPIQPIVDEENRNEIELNEMGIAEATEKNLITLLELVKENECLWNFTLPIEKRNSHLIGNAWFNIAKKFSGWTPKIAKDNYNYLKNIFTRRNVKPRSGAAGKQKKYWIFDEHFSFLRGVMNPSSTTSNISSSEIAEESVHANIRKLGFEKKESNESPISSKRRKPLDPLEEALIENINNKMTQQRDSRKSLNEIQQWGQWMSQEIQNFSPTDRLEVQAFITNYIFEKKKISVFNNEF
ncbi:uncharacterized protein LOC127290369 [Leptopilina boulardi]|uniref:uncharacterized protein LOC127278167 n=1 Tax=Leptopilina boulardi TaxID=63433 RepID=UPI0021F59BAA|nr:uncharacterized protein LOC127278167 [Leptopilina boulardi]XP_051155703.1 uncharacterized protein LOC127278168 [Leptopilina boulardi]XP_051158554.1 uncharacterized protein LOC127279937 [Leptopilina boulardi]XP_051162380.1 uncharacterized protein LOC127282252 [Leptopilina boulardi]XP_051174831.1 uncharacterized protein LOC127290369 [Leptopilina boulardi]